MRKIFLLLQILFFITSSLVYSQGLSKREVVQIESEAYRNYKELNFHEALPLYLTLDSIQPNDAKYIFPLGVCYLYFNNVAKALPYLEACKEKKEISSASLDYYLGKAYHLNLEFEKAIQS